MMTIKHKIKESNIHGIGVFAVEFIPKGTKIWEFTDGFDLKYELDNLYDLPQTVQDYLKIYGWISKNTGKFCFASDNGKYINHSKQNNVQSSYFENIDECVTYAIKDINIGEELLDDYDSFEENGSVF